MNRSDDILRMVCADARLGLQMLAADVLGLSKVIMYAIGVGALVAIVQSIPGLGLSILIGGAVMVVAEAAREGRS